ncbi:hypothetical protein [Pseudomonas lactucae]|uniref:hypothetical protein n=1 Tax=Pseudomonas lactucae TaxID=2813360 RepID=UPI001967D19E|nr:hypothetical protein [Pseudomonas lactucae]MBN2987424.1 hypothetical protein [Pseudomonas lactucae]
MTIITPSRVLTPSITLTPAPVLVTQPSPTGERASSTSVLDNPAALRRAFSDSCDWQTLAKHLQSLWQALGSDSRYTDADLTHRLKTTFMSLCDEQGLTSGARVSLEAFLQGKGLSAPGNLAALGDLKQWVTRQAQVHPLGNFSGALSWPMPPSIKDQRSIVSLVQGTAFADERKGTLGYLLSGSSVSDADLQKPTLAIEKLLGSAKAQTLGQAIQTQLGGYATHSSLNEYLLAAIHLGLDPESLDAPAPNTVAGFDLAHEAHRGQGAQTIIDNLARHLLDKGRVTAQTANLGARLLLAKTAPQFLVKDIPRSVTYGSLTWAQLAIATARIEADSPGRSLNLTYAQVLAYGEQVETRDAVLQEIQKKVLTDWGEANGLPTGDVSIETLRITFNRQMQALTAASSQVQTPIPRRREMALDALKAAFPDLDPKLFEIPSLVQIFRKPGRTGRHPGIRSMLDVAMHGAKLGTDEHWESADKRIPAAKFCSLFESGRLDVAASFKAAYDQAITSLEQGQQGLADYLISTLPPQDRKNFEFGQLEFFHTSQYTMAMDFFTKPSLRTRGHTLRVKTTLNGEVNIYEIDTRRATIEQQSHLRYRYTPPYTAKNLEHLNANVITKTVLFDPFKDEADQARERSPVNADNPAFGSTRSDYIGRVFAKSLDLHNDDLLQQARGVTSFDKDAATNRAIGEFFLNLIPLRSAIVNFSNGNVGDGLFDLGMDVIGLVTLGAGKAAQASRVLSKGISSFGAVTKVARFLGATAIEAFNPFSGLGGVAQGGARLVAHGAAKGVETVNKLRGASGSYDLLKAASKHYGEAAIGSLTTAGRSIENGAVLHNGKWYGFDPDRMRPYGAPLEGFTPSTRAVDGVISPATIEPARALGNTQFASYQVPASRIAGLTPDSRGVYVAADGIRRTSVTLTVPA